MSDYDSGIKRLKSDVSELRSDIITQADIEAFAKDINDNFNAATGMFSVEQTRAKRFNAGKLRPSLIPVEWLEELMVVMEKGASKYGDDNWKLAMPYKECLDSLERHLIEFKKRIDFDPDDGLRTITKVAVNALFLAYWQMKGLGDDNR